MNTADFKDRQSMSLQGLEAVCRSLSIHVVGLGGINMKNARQVIAAGAAGVNIVPYTK